MRVHRVDGHWVVAIDGEDRLTLDPPRPYDPLDDVRHHLEHVFGDIFI